METGIIILKSMERKAIYNEDKELREVQNQLNLYGCTHARESEIILPYNGTNKRTSTWWC